MADVTKTVKFLVLGDSKGAVGALKGTAKGFLANVKAAQGLKGKAAIAGGALLAVGAAAAVVGVAIAVKFGKKSIDTYKAVAAETLALKRVTGETAEEASRLGFSFKQSGVDVAVGQKSLQLFSKNLATANDGGKKAAAMNKLLGFSFTDAKGKILPMAELLPKVADRFSKMPDGPEKTALAMKLFGKSGTAMLPFLNKGAEGLAALSKKSDEFGHTLNDSQLDALKKSKQAHRDLDAAMQGLEITLGSELLPIVNEVFEGFESVAIPALKGMGQYVRENHTTFEAMGRVFKQVWNAILLPLVKLAIIGFAQMNKPLAQGVQLLGMLTGNKDMETFGAGLVKAADDATAFANSLQGIPDEVTPTISARDEATAKIAKVDQEIKGLKGKIVTAKANGDDKGLKALQAKLRAAENEKHRLKVEVSAFANPSADEIKLRTVGKGSMRLSLYGTGTNYARKGWAITGDQGPELVKFRGGERVQTATRTREMLRQASVGRAAPIASAAGAQSRSMSLIQHIAVTVKATPGTDRVALGRELYDLLHIFKRQGLGTRPLGFEGR